LVERQPKHLKYQSIMDIYLHLRAAKTRLITLGAVLVTSSEKRPKTQKKTKILAMITDSPPQTRVLDK
jgi:hypothetical protein